MNKKEKIDMLEDMAQKLRSNTRALKYDINKDNISKELCVKLEDTVDAINTAIAKYRFS